MDTKTQKVRKALTLSVSEKAKWIEQFESKSSFPSKEVPCSSCNEGITMFGTNLKNRVERYESVENFLDTFVCRTCKGKIKKGEKVSPQAPTSNYESSDEVVTNEDDSINEGSYVVEPGDDDEALEIQDDEEVEVTSEEPIQVFDDSDEFESDEPQSDESDNVESNTSSLDAQALREKYKAFYAMKR